MATTIGEVTVTLNLDTATTALRAIVDAVEHSESGRAELRRLALAGLAQCQAEQSEANRLRAALRELTQAIRGWEYKDGIVLGSWYEGRITEKCLIALEELCGTKE